MLFRRAGAALVAGGARYRWRSLAWQQALAWRYWYWYVRPMSRACVYLFAFFCTRLLTVRLTQHGEHTLRRARARVIEKRAAYQSSTVALFYAEMFCFTRATRCQRAYLNAARARCCVCGDIPALVSIKYRARGAHMTGMLLVIEEEENRCVSSMRQRRRHYLNICYMPC